MYYALFLVGISVGSLAYGQTPKLALFSLGEVTVNTDGLSFNITNVRDETGTAAHGRVYVGVENAERELVFKDNLEMQLTSLMVRSIVDRELPPATLVVHDLRYDDEVDGRRKFNRLQLRVSVETYNNGDTARYGPTTKQGVVGGVHNHGGRHAQQLAAYISEALAVLDADVRRGHTVSTMQDQPWIDHSALADGAYYSYIDFRAGRVDRTLQFDVSSEQHVANLDGRDYHSLEFSRRPGLKLRDARQVWGYQHGGRSYMLLEGSLHEVQGTEPGLATVVVPGGLRDVTEISKRIIIADALTMWLPFGEVLSEVVGEVVTKGGNLRDGVGVLQLDLQTGALRRKPLNIPPAEPITAGTILYYPGKIGDPSILVSLPNELGWTTIGPGEYTVIETNGTVELRLVNLTSGRKAKASYHDIDSRLGLSVLFVNRKGKRRVTTRLGTPTEARLVAQTIQRGDLGPVRR